MLRILNITAVNSSGKPGAIRSLSKDMGSPEIMTASPGDT
jgi:hypothetical protein